MVWQIVGVRVVLLVFVQDPGVAELDVLMNEVAVHLLGLGILLQSVLECLEPLLRLSSRVSEFASILAERKFDDESSVFVSGVCCLEVPLAIVNFAGLGRLRVDCPKTFHQLDQLLSVPFLGADLVRLDAYKSLVAVYRSRHEPSQEALLQQR
uniref:(northern house mosquito) hypothetical protein n=1 Tax=Culex pipiens TaxID=7175 RepID=A0A8D8FDQ9_CULPI